VAIIDENDIWAVGEIYTEDTYTYDSLGNFIQPYNAAHWDGQMWELVHINGNGTPINIILAFSKDDIWFQGLLHWNGTQYTLHKNNFPLMPNGDGWRMHATWGTSSSDFYVVGDYGMIAHYNGTSWTKIESGTDLDLEDLTGNAQTVLTYGFWFESKLIKINKGVAATLLYSNNYYANLPNSKYGRFSSLFYKEPFWYVWSTAGLIRYFDGFKNIYLTPAIDIGTEELRIIDIAVNDINDLFLIDAFGTLLSFNGSSWKSDTQFLIKYGAGNLLPKRMDYKGRDIIIAGYHQSADKTIILLGKRN